METSGEHLPVGVHAAEVRALAEQPGPMVSVYLNTPGDLDHAAQFADLHWHDLRRELASRGADPEALEHVTPVVGPAHELGPALAAFATAGGLLHVEHGPEPLPGDVGRWDRLPVLGPLLRWRQDSVPYVVVLTDRRGADIAAFGVGPAEEHVDVDPDPDDSEPIRKIKPGGWRQRKIQQRAERTWESHAHEVADAVRGVSDDIGAQVIVVGGDVRAVELLEAHLPDRLLLRLHEISGGRAPGVDTERMQSEVRRWVRDAAARTTVAALEKFREESGQDDRAADGVDATLAALSESRVDVLLVHDDPDDERRAWSGPDPTPVVATPELLEGLGITEAEPGRLVDVAIRAALGTGAGVRLVPKAGGPSDGLGAILRWH
jgi:peptide subunit release factor 1 (eRF1)